MDWISDRTDRSCTLTVGAWQAVVMRAPTGEWLALVSRDGTPVSHARFLFLSEAQAWCKAQIAELSKQ